MSHLIVFLLLPLRHSHLFLFQAITMVMVQSIKNHLILFTLAQDRCNSNRRTKVMTEHWGVKQSFFQGRKSVAQESREKDTWFWLKEVTVMILSRQDFTHDEKERSTES